MLKTYNSKSNEYQYLVTLSRSFHLFFPVLFLDLVKKEKLHLDICNLGSADHWMEQLDGDQNVKSGLRTLLHWHNAEPSCRYHNHRNSHLWIRNHRHLYYHSRFLNIQPFQFDIVRSRQWNLTLFVTKASYSPTFHTRINPAPSSVYNWYNTKLVGYYSPPQSQGLGWKQQRLLIEANIEYSFWFAR